MQNILSDFSAHKLVRESIKANWENYHYCLGRSPSVELSIGRYLTWFVTNMPDHFMNLVVCTDLPDDGVHELIGNTLTHFRSLNVGKLTWLADEGALAAQIKKHLAAHRSTFREASSREMAADLMALREDLPVPNGLEIVPVENGAALQQWIHIASIGFDVPEEYEKVWYDFFVEAVLDPPFRTYLALWNGQPVATSQLFLSAGVAGIYNVTCIPGARGQGIGAAITLAPALAARGMGYRIGILQASELGASVYRRLGFQDFGKRSIFLWENNANLLSS
jgi:hypothetical protein